MWNAGPGFIEVAAHKSKTAARRIVPIPTISRAGDYRATQCGAGMAAEQSLFFSRRFETPLRTQRSGGSTTRYGTRSFSYRLAEIQDVNLLHWKQALGRR
jgi:hypothetical protein